jgi:GNAT superfamily N-acetyltransferase
LARCHRNLAEAFWQYTKAVPGATRRSIGGGTAIRCDLSSAQANSWILAEPDGSIETAFREAVAFYGPKRPWRVLTDGPRTNEVARAAVGNGLRPLTSEPGMILDPIGTSPTRVPGLSIHTVQSRAELDDFATVWCSSFRIPRFVFPLVLPAVLTEDPAHGAQSRLLVGYAGERPVACSSVVVTEAVAGVVSVGTTPDARGKGYGTALTWQAVEEGRHLGADVAFLGATAMGYSVYLKMGFRRVAEYPSWAAPVGFFRQLRAAVQMWRLARAQTSPT